METLPVELNTDEKKELCAVQLMRTMLEKHAERAGVTFEEDFLRFSVSPAYDALFDYDTGIWRDGPDYLETLYEQSLANEPGTA